ncbi:hypothetical protein ACQPZX_23290 [Actinoplanes sp. CA-142083]|uniref:hypothetical protein n=1 Tax=Actinoplanes sp. CA-142083 TaxID=3239903 RepID=UPI003D8ED524
MNAFFDAALIETDIDSGALGMLGAVVRRFEEPGTYRATVRLHDRTVQVFYLSVDKDSPVAAADIDLANLDGCDSETFSVNPRGYALFRVSGGKGGYSVRLRRTDPDERTPVFDTAALDGGSAFAARVLRPGTYAVSNSLGDGRARLKVAYPPAAFSGYRPPDALHVEVTRQGFEPERIELMPLQGLIFDCHAPARIVIRLEDPDDGPG